MIKINTENFESEVVRSESLVFVEFTAQWCTFCKNMEKVMETVEHELTDVKFCSVDIDKERELAQKYSIKGVPTSLVFKDGTVKSRKTGALTKADVYTLLERKPAQTASAN